MVATPPHLVPGAPDRAWMDAFQDRHPYRCLPLSIAHTHCWELLVPAAFEVTWNGGPAVEDLTLKPLEAWPATQPFSHFAHSNFSRGIVTFHAGYMFRTPPGWSLLATGPYNDPRPGIYPLTGIVETDWLPYPFTMNWKMLAPGTVRFEKDEVFCALMPIPKGYLEGWDVAVHSMDDDPVLQAEHETFRAERESFMERFRAQDPQTLKQAWQRHYFVGRHPDGTKVEAHANKLRLAEPRDRVGSRPLYAKDAPASAAAAKILAAPRKSVPAEPIVAQPEALPVVRAKPTPWRDSSVLNTIDPAQDDRNRAGRKRIVKGVLQSSAETVTYMPAAHDGALDFLCVPEFLSATECALLTQVATRLSGQHNDAGIADPYWRGRILFVADVFAAHEAAGVLMRRAQDRITQQLGDFYQLTAPIYADTVQLVQWPAGMFMQPHADRANPDGRAHGFPHRDFASLVYLNDDYEGGELYFPRLDLVLRPTAGMMVTFTGGWHHEHGVLLVKSGLRLTMPAFYTFDAEKKDRTFYVD